MCGGCRGGAWVRGWCKGSEVSQIRTCEIKFGNSRTRYTFPLNGGQVALWPFQLACYSTHRVVLFIQISLHIGTYKSYLLLLPFDFIYLSVHRLIASLI